MERDMSRSGVIAYRNTDGTFQNAKAIRKEDQKPDNQALTFFARLVLQAMLDEQEKEEK